MVCVWRARNAQSRSCTLMADGVTCGGLRSRVRDKTVIQCAASFELWLSISSILANNKSEAPAKAS